MAVIGSILSALPAALGAAESIDKALAEKRQRDAAVRALAQQRAGAAVVMRKAAAGAAGTGSSSGLLVVAAIAALVLMSGNSRS